MFSTVFQLEFGWFRDQTRCRMSVSATLNDSIADTARIQEAHKVIIHLLCELAEPDLANQ
jgi:hypothetical protein